MCVCVCAVSAGVCDHAPLNGDRSVKLRLKGVLPKKSCVLFGGYQNTIKMSKASLEVAYVNELIKD